MNQKVNSTAKVNPWIGVAVVLAILIALNVIAHTLRFRIDLTGEKLFTLSPGSEQFIQQLESPVTLKLYYSRGNEVPVMLKQFAQRIVDMLHEIEHVSSGKVIIELYDPSPDSDEEEWAQRYGIIGQSLSPLGGGDMIYLGLVAVSGQREATIPFLAPNAEDQMEYDITRLLHEVTRKSKPKLGVISSLPVMGPPMSVMRGRSTADDSWISLNELKRHFDVEPLRTEIDSIPDDITALLVIHPKEMPETTLYAIDQYVVGGGRLIVFEDPLCLIDRATSQEMSGMGMMMDFSSDLNRLTKTWGAEMPMMDVLADPKAASPVTFASGQAERMPSWLSLRRESANNEDVLTSGLNQLIFPFAGGFNLSNVDGVTSTALVVTSDETEFVNAFQATMPGPEKMRNARQAGAKPVAVRLYGKFTSSFTNKPFVASSGDLAVTNIATHLTRGEKDGLVILVGDVDFIHDQHAFRIMNIMGQRIAEFANDNFNFMLGMVEQATGSDALIGLRRRGVEDRSFTRVLALEEQAQKRWQAEELKLLDKLQETQRRIGELQQVKNDDQQFIVSPEQKAEIENFRKVRFETQRELKEVRRNLRREIESLGFQVKAINLAAVPLCVALFGLARGWYRRRG